MIIIKDCRTIQAEKIIEVDKEINNKEYFLNQMLQKGYIEKYVDVLTKEIEGYEITINLTTTDVNFVDNIIVYQDNVPVDVPEELLLEVEQDINECLGQEVIEQNPFETNYPLENL